ncbi:hypothetical protein GCM10010156_43760 [Planobispora rosea]|uniref:Uncharacterized protein n=1 Tax=Planobispora rosea TaxID=35762 RepID=A0A8J3S2U1_PLARO|nr:DUF5969 family protein [Planobispora rosea]GGS80261.1 hypothetical protein GCM10010156_43760 [Planobispora rosea]GIH86033.1 hypothetical protein Pro02_44410 [Planobispora rosea]
MSAEHPYHDRLRALFAYLRKVDSDPAVASELQEDPEKALRAAGVDQAFDRPEAFQAFVGKLSALSGEAWLATVHSMIELCENGSDVQPPTGPNISFRLSGDGSVTAIANRGEVAKKVQPNPFYTSGKSASAGSRLRIYPEYATSELSARLSERYLSTFYQRTLLKRVVLDPATVVEDADAGEGVTVSRSHYKGVEFDLHTRAEGADREIIAAFVR